MKRQATNTDIGRIAKYIDTSHVSHTCEIRKESQRKKKMKGSSEERIRREREMTSDMFTALVCVGGGYR
jgi:hypothetical protein